MACREDLISSTSLTLHASAACVADGALVFLGPSQSGKSTLCRLIGAFAEPFADDRVRAIWTAEGNWVVADASASKSESPPKMRSTDVQAVPLKAVFRLYQSSEVHLEHINALETCRFLADAVFEIFEHRLCSNDTKKAAFAHIATMARSVPGYELFFNLSPRVAQIISNQVNDNNAQYRTRRAS